MVRGSTRWLPLLFVASLAGSLVAGPTFAAAPGGQAKACAVAVQAPAPESRWGSFFKRLSLRRGISYDHALFLDYKEKLASGLAPEQVAVGTDALSMEFVLALVEKADASALAQNRTLTQLLENGTERERQRVLALVAKLKPETEMASGSIAVLLENIYFNVHPSTLGFLESFVPGKLIRESLRVRIETEIATKNFVDAIESLGFVTDPSLLAQLRGKLKDRPTLYRLPMALALDALSIPMLHFPILIPQISLVDLTAVPEAIERSVREKGFDASYDLIRRHYKIRSRADLTYQWGRSIYQTFAMASLGMLLVTNGPMIANAVRMPFVSHHALVELQRTKYTPDFVRHQQLDSYAEFIRLQNNREPTKEELAAKWDELRAEPDQDFQIEE